MTAGGARVMTAGGARVMTAGGARVMTAGGASCDDGRGARVMTAGCSCDDGRGSCVMMAGSSDEDRRDEAQRKEDEIILLLKKAKLSLSRDQLQEASVFLHQALALAHQTHNNQAIIYCYSLVTCDLCTSL
ncbi:hypothetical protein F7725_010774 [Dissostichus mawsoni]|uniref:Uncharacterized protein n=1 Tax=Dissostichus mawsoni TaxID=36200 RepID=A0A7J5Z7R4_DISMA|nr:hypothetical protein F7725_010774 [Dissostichus mawsoni]